VDPIAILGQYNKLGFEQPKNGDIALAALDKLPETTQEIRDCCADLKVLGRKEFKLLLKWRLKVREILGFPSKKTTLEAAEEVAEVEPMDEELQIQEDLQKMKERESGKKKRERRRENEKKQKEIVRMQMNMTAPMDIGMEQEGPRGEGAIFRLKGLDQTSALTRLAKGKMTITREPAKKPDHDSGLGSSGETDDESDEDGDRLETELDALYDKYRERKMEADAKYRAKKARQEHDDEEWEGVSADGKSDSEDEELEGFEDSSDEDEPETEKGASKALLRDLNDTPADANGLSKRAANFFNQGIFQDIEGLLDFSDEEEVEEVAVAELAPKSQEKAPAKSKSKTKVAPPPKEAKEEKDHGFEVVKKKDDEDWEEVEKRTKDGRPSKLRPFHRHCCEETLTAITDIDIITAEAMTLAHQLASGEKTSYDLVDDGFNKLAFKDRDGLPEWFLDDEGKHDRPHRPITKAGADAIKEKMRAYNARPIKKVAEARARKKFKQAQKLEKLKKKADIVAGDEGMSEKDKASSIAKLISAAGRKAKRQPMKVIKASGSNRGISGRPRGGTSSTYGLWMKVDANSLCYSQGAVQDGGPPHEEGNAGDEEDIE